MINESFQGFWKQVKKKFFFSFPYCLFFVVHGNLIFYGLNMISPRHMFVNDNPQKHDRVFCFYWIFWEPVSALKHMSSRILTVV